MQQTAVCSYRQYIQWFPTERYIISCANLRWREQQIALERSPNPNSNTQAPYQGLHLVPIVLSLCHVLKHRPGCAAKPEYLQAWETVRVGLKHFTWAPSLKKTAEEEQSKMNFQGWKKKGVQCIWWVSRGLFATCVKGQVKHNRREKLGKATARLWGSGCHQAPTATWKLPVTHFLTCALAPEPIRLLSKGDEVNGAFC